MKEVWTRTYGKVTIQRYINKQCIDVGLCINWNYKPGIEISLLFWRIWIDVDVNLRKTITRIMKEWRGDNVTRIDRHQTGRYASGIGPHAGQIHNHTGRILDTLVDEDSR